MAALYLLSPVDLVPELLMPVFGFLDDADADVAVAALALRSGQPPPPTARVVDTIEPAQALRIGAAAGA